MSISLSDLITYAAVNQPEDETSTAGGAIDTNTRVVFTDLAANDDVEVVSDNAADTTQMATLVGRNPAGELVSETVALNGVTPVVFSVLGILERIESFSLDSDAAGTVTVQRSPGGASIGTVPAGERGFTRLFIEAFSAASTKDYYAKIFFLNNHGTLSLTNATVKENADPTGKITFAVATALNDTETTANRLTAPAAVTAFGNSDITLLSAIGSANLPAGDTIGVWAKMSLDADNAPIKSTWTVELDGNSV